MVQNTQSSPRIYTLGELLVEIMRPPQEERPLPGVPLLPRVRPKPWVPLDCPGEFRGPFPSGAPAIFISTAARLGAETAIIGGVGRDKFGQNLLQRLHKDGVNCEYINQSPRPTAVAFVAYQEDGEREFIYHISGTAADDLAPSSLAALPQPDAFHLMGCSLMASPILRQAALEALRYFSENFCTISFDPNLRPELLKEQSFDEVAGEVMAHCNILLPGEVELLLCATGKSQKIPSNTDTLATKLENAAGQLFERYAQLRLIHLKCGARGSRIYTREGQKLEIAPYPKIMKVIDPTGAGDCFDAAFVWALLKGFPLEKAGFLAAKAGALNTTALGPMEGDMSLLHKNLLPEDQTWL